MSKIAKRIKGKISNLSISKNIPPIILKTTVTTPKTRANKRMIGEKAKTIMMKSNFNPIINNKIAMKISMFPPIFNTILY
ncbi:MAG: hypothetical protein AB8B80_16765 [Marinicellaceae bacterium]